MADTGAPWNLPYPLATDLVRDGAQAIEDLAEAVATGLTASVNAGIGSNVVQATRTDTFSASLSQGGTSSAVLSATITPSSATSKVLVLVQANIAQDAARPVLDLYRDGSIVFRGDAAGSRSRRTVGAFQNDDSMQAVSIVYLDSPGVATATTYDIRIGNGAASSRTVYLNRSLTDTDSNAFARGATSLVVIEVAA